MPIHLSSTHLPHNLPAHTTTRVRPPRPAVESLLGSADASPDVQADNARRHAERVRKGELGNAQETGGSSARERGAQGESARNAEDQNALDPAQGGSGGTRVGQKPEVSEEIIADEKSDMASDPTDPAPEPSAPAADARGEDEPLASSERAGASNDGEADAQPEPVFPTTPSPTPVQHSGSSVQTNQQDDPKDKPVDTQRSDQEGRWEDPEGEFELSPSTSAAGADAKDQGTPGGGREQVVKYESKDATVDQSAVKRGKSGSPQKKKVAIKSAGPVSTRQKRIKSGSPSRPAEKMGPPAPPAAPRQMVVCKGGPPSPPASKQRELQKKW